MSAKILQISTRASDSRLTLDQQRFNFLIEHIERVRKTREEWEANIVKFRSDHSQRLQPLRASLRSLCRDSVIVLDRLTEQPGWSRADRASLREMLCGTAEALLDANANDAELKALYDKHSEVDFDTAKQEEFQRLKEKAEEMTGLDLGQGDIRNEEDLVQRLYQEMAARGEDDDADEEPDDSRQSRRQSAAQKRALDNAQMAKQSLREIYRKLASALHPDRESDPRRREEKTMLMQKINQAYAANDLLTLFETQMQIEQIDEGHIRKVSTERLKQYNKLLAEQLAALQAKLNELKSGFCSDFGLPSSTALTPQKLEMVTRGHAREIRSEITQQQQFLQVLADKAALKRWLKQRRRSPVWDEDLED